LENYTLVVKLAQDARGKGSPAQRLYDALIDFECLVGMAALVPSMDRVQYLNKFVQGRDVYIGDLAAALRICEQDIYAPYLDPSTSFLF